MRIKIAVFWDMRPLVSNDSVKTPVARQQIPITHQWTNWEAVFSTRSVRQLRDATTELLEAVFPMRSVPRCYNQDKSRF
jgi:hypothetical protein